MFQAGHKPTEGEISVPEDPKLMDYLKNFFTNSLKLA